MEYERVKTRKVKCSEESDEIYCGHLEKPIEVEECESIYYYKGSDCSNGAEILKITNPSLEGPNTEETSLLSTESTPVSKFTWQVSTWTNSVNGCNFCDSKYIWRTRSVKCYIGKYLIDDLFCQNSFDKPVEVNFCDEKCEMDVMLLASE